VICTRFTLRDLVQPIPPEYLGRIPRKKLGLDLDVENPSGSDRVLKEKEKEKDGAWAKTGLPDLCEDFGTLLDSKTP
jgi:hypothetical protein